MTNSIDVIGLKGCMKQYKGMTLRGKIDRFYTELRWAIQRAWRGYDDRDVWATNFMSRDRMILVLEDYKKSRHCYWWIPVSYVEEIEKSNGDVLNNFLYDENCDRYMFTNEQLDAILDTIIFHLKMSDEDYCEKEMFGNNVFDDDYRYKGKDEYLRITDVRKQNQDAAFELLRLFWDQMWD